MITAVAIDDEPLALGVIKEFCRQTEGVELQETFTKTGLVLEYLEQHPVDLLFLDINMPTISGIDFYKKVGPNTMAIFTTAYSEYAVEGFDLNAVDYILKPFSLDRFQRAVEKAKEYHDFLTQKNQSTPQFLFVKVEYSIKKIPFADVLYIEGQDNYLKIYVDGGKHYLVRMSMKAIEPELPAKDFIRVHRSFIVPFKKITSIRHKTVFLDTIEIPISTPYHDNIRKLFNENIKP